MALVVKVLFHTTLDQKDSFEDLLTALLALEVHRVEEQEEQEEQVEGQVEGQVQPEVQRLE